MRSNRKVIICGSGGDIEEAARLIAELKVPDIEVIFDPMVSEDINLVERNTTLTIEPPPLLIEPLFVPPETRSERRKNKKRKRGIKIVSPNIETGIRLSKNSRA